MGARSAVGPAVALWLGLALGGGAPLGGTAALAALGCAALFAWLALRAPDRVGTLAILIAIALAAAARGAGHRAWLERQRAGLEDEARPWRLSATVLAPPAREADQPEAVVEVRSAPGGFTSGARSDPSRTGALPPGTRLRLRLPAGCDAEWGDRVELLARLEVPPTLRNPGGFDALATADAAGIAATGRAFWCRVREPRGAAGWPRATVARWRRAIESALASHLGPAARELTIPLVTGDRSALSTDLSAAFRASGLVHLLALSGLHVVWLASLARGLCGALGGGLAARALAGVLCALGYAGIAGPLPSLLRAVATEGVAAVARLAGRALDPLQALAVGVAALLAVAPGWAGDLGFQLSCAATLGLCAVAPGLAERCGRARVLAAPLLPTVAAQLTATPILLARFHALPWAGLAANLLAVPVTGLLLAAAWAGVLLELAATGLGHWMFGACEVLASALRAIATRAGGFPGALPGTGSEPGIAWCAGAGAALLALSLPGPRTLLGRARPAARVTVVARGLGALLTALALILAWSARPLRPPPGRWWLVALDVGQGDALALGFEDGSWWLVDAGPRSPSSDAGERTVLPFLRWAAVRRLEGVALTHDDGDHTGGAGAIRRGVTVTRWWAPDSAFGVAGPGARFAAARAARGDTLRGGPTLRVVWPPRGGSDTLLPAAPTAGASPDNRAGLVLEVGAGEGRALLLADVDSTVEAALEVAPGVAVIKVAHHGSASSSGASFLARARGRVALLSVGRHNPFGHPSPGALARLAGAGLEIRRTDREGAIWIEHSGAGARVVDWRHSLGAGAPRARGTRVRPPDAAPRE